MIIEFNDNGDMTINYENNVERLALKSWINTNVLFREDQISINMGSLTIEDICGNIDLIDTVLEERAL